MSMPMYSPNRAKPAIRPGQDTPNGRGSVPYMNFRDMPNKATIPNSKAVMMSASAGDNARRAPKSDILR